MNSQRNQKNNLIDQTSDRCYHLLENRGKTALGLLGSLQNFIVCDPGLIFPDTYVGNDAHGKYRKSHVIGYYALLHGTHPNSITAQCLDKFVFSMGFVCGTCNSIIYSFP